MTTRDLRDIIKCPFCGSWHTRRLLEDDDPRAVRKCMNCQVAYNPADHYACDPDTNVIRCKEPGKETTHGS